MDKNGKIWRNIARYMEIRGETITSLAEKSGVRRQSLHLIKNRGTANTDTLEKIATALKIEINMLLTP